MNTSDNAAYILILEDDPDQMELLTSFVLDEVTILLSHQDMTEDHIEKLKGIQILKASSIQSLKKAVSICKEKRTLLAVLDCNTPDNIGGKAHDQLIKTNYRITGQHKSTDIVLENLPNTPITMVSSLNRFQKIVSQYYEKNLGSNINFIRKHDDLMIKRNIRFYLRKYLKKE